MTGVQTWCSSDLANHAADTQVGRIPDIGREYLAIPEERRPAWRDFPPVARREQAMEQAIRSHPDYAQPSQDCDYCHGTGMRETSDNASGTVFENCVLSNGDMDLSIYTTAEIPGHMEDIDPEHLLTPDGIWHRIEWGIPDPYEVWHQRIRQLLERYPDHRVVVAYLNT